MIMTQEHTEVCLDLGGETLIGQKGVRKNERFLSPGGSLHPDEISKKDTPGHTLVLA